MTRHITYLYPALLPAIVGAFTPSRQLHQSSSSGLNYQTFPADRQSDPANPSNAPNAVLKPEWVPMELISILASDKSMNVEDFISLYVDGEVYTSCDDEGDELHECDFFGMYLGPTKWLHLTSEAHNCIDQIHFKIWQDVWANPHSSVDVADKVSKKVLGYCKDVLQTQHQIATTPTKPLIKIKVIPASFGLEAFEDAIWEATQELLASSLSNDVADCDVQEAMTSFVVASPDLSDPILTEHGCKNCSPQAEFACDSFEAFVDTLHAKLETISRLESVSLNDVITVQAFHPLWDGKFPYPCVAVSIEQKAS